MTVYSRTTSRLLSLRLRLSAAHFRELIVTKEHQYTTDEEEAAKWRKLRHWNDQVIVGFVSPSELETTVRLDRGSKANGRHVDYVGQRPSSVQTVDDNFKAHVWRTGDDDRVGV